MSNTSLEEKIDLYEHFFRDPKVRTLGPGCSGIACRNIRDALRVLDYPNKEGDHYDSELLEVVQKFQKLNRQDGEERVRQVLAALSMQGLSPPSPPQHPSPKQRFED